ncbi:MAG TPA: hypothetical protein VH040_15755 [Usitatibacter sp.]|jgi:hypothetical protein|nr:hypothetical protein [Usitatibacter sp.]
MSPRILAAIAIIVAIMIVGMVLTVKRSVKAGIAREADIATPAKPATR